MQNPFEPAKGGKSLNILVALSGGVDSAVAASLLLEAGHTVCGLHFILPSPEDVTRLRVTSAKNVARFLRIPLEVLDLRAIFEKDLIAPFVDDYLNGRTPNPCVRCNPLIKFEQMYRHLKGHHFHFMATGHYVRIKRRGGTDNVTLWRGRDPHKDQSYFLHRLNQRQLQKTLFPLGHMTKAQTREKARRLDIPCHGDSESQEICFIPQMDYRHFIESRKDRDAFKKGPIVNLEGDTVGEHEGIHRYTVGQRHGLGIASLRPYYVKSLDPKGNRVIVGRREDLFSKEVLATDFHRITPFDPMGSAPMRAQVRYRHRAAQGRLEELSGNRVKFVFREPQMAITPGQALVCYQGDRVLGGGWIVQDI
jgi:tRNA-specific 2-thiouridylase